MVCALYIPEVRFGDVATMEPVLLSHLPPDRFGKVGRAAVTAAGYWPRIGDGL